MSEQGLGRSRSPRDRWDSDRISRTVTMFGRYPTKRPPGLRVDAGGAFLLANLMEVWGSRHGLEESEVVEALRRNMLHQGRECSLRFGLTTDDTGTVTVRVHPGRRHRSRSGSGGDGARGGRSPPPQAAGRARSADGAPHPAKPGSRSAYALHPPPAPPPPAHAFSGGSSLTRVERRAMRVGVFRGQAFGNVEGFDSRALAAPGRLSAAAPATAYGQTASALGGEMDVQVVAAATSPSAPTTQDPLTAEQKLD
ncbi:unnamed protein product, partial [Prorocentrum cordatum]